MIGSRKQLNRVSVVVPNYVLRDAFGEPTSPPLGPALVASSLREAGFEVDLIDADAENLTVDETAARVLAFGPEAVGISCNYITKHNPTIRLARRIKEQSDAFVFIGGNHASAYSEAFLGANGPIDCVLTGEGEAEAPTLIQALNMPGLSKQFPGVWFANGQPTRFMPPGHVEQLDSLPLPLYDLLPMRKYLRYELVTSRGCPYICSFCASTEITGRKVRLRTPASVVQEVVALRKTYGERQVWISDDTFTAIRKHTLAVSAELKDVNPQFKWSCFSTATTLSTELLTAMKAAGCEYTSIGVETTHEKQRRFVGKRVSDDLISDTVKRAHDAGIRVYGFIIVGFPGENRETLESRYRLIERAKFDDVGVNMLIPLPGTMIWKELTEQKLFDPRELEMDYLFARLSDAGDSERTAALAARWTELTAKELLEGVEKCRELGKASSPNWVPRVLPTPTPSVIESELIQVPC